MTFNIAFGYMMSRVALLALCGVKLLANTAIADQPFGPVGTLGPSGAEVRTCEGLSNCSICTPSSCSPSGGWQHQLETALPGETILLRTGTYVSEGEIELPPGSAGHLITIANYQGEPVKISGGMVFMGGHLLLEGLTIISTSSNFTLEIFSEKNPPLQNIELRHLDVLGGMIEAIRVSGNVHDLILSDSLVDGGRDHHVMKVLCDDNSSTPDAASCSFLPENIVITNNRFSKVRSPFFPRPSRTASEDLLATELAGDMTITHNQFGENDYEECIDVKPQGRPGTAIIFSRNIVDSRGAGKFPSRSRGCQGGMLFHQYETSGSTVIEGNWFPGGGPDGGNLIRATHIGTQVINNLFDQLTISADDVILAHNTFMEQSELKLGDSTGNPASLTIANNIFDRTVFKMRGRYTARNNLHLQTRGTVSCPDCLTSDATFSGYRIQPGSSAQDAASPLFSVMFDIEGTRRPQGVAADIGAYELLP